MPLPTPQDLWKTIRRARLIQVLAVYLASSFVVLQATDILVDRLALPDWVFPVAFVLLLIGLPMVTATAVVQSAAGGANGNGSDPPAPPPADRAEREDGLMVGASLPDWDEPSGVGTEEAGGAPALSGDTVDADAVRSGPARSGPRWDPDGDGQVTLADVAAVAKQWLTWHRTLAGGVLAFTLLVIAVSGYTAMRTLGIGPIGSLVAAGVLDHRERILVADFQSHDSALAGVVTEAFRIDFSQSPVVTVVDRALVRDVLGRMGAETGAELEYELAREVALRDGIKAFVTGEITAAGTGYVLTARLVSTADEQVLAALRETATDDRDLIPAIDRLSKKLRERIGESLRTIRAAPPLADVTTRSLDALRRYTQALHAEDVARDRNRALALLNEAIALDTAFAMAYRKLAVVLRNEGEDRARRIDALTRAHRHLDRLTERERYLTLAAYHADVTGDSEQTLLAYRSLLELDPDDPWALNNLGVHYSSIRDWSRAAEYYRRAFRADSTSTLPLTNMIFVLVNDGRYDEAWEGQLELERRWPGHRTAAQYRIGWALLRREWDTADRQAELVAEQWGEDVSARVLAARTRAVTAALQGQLRAAERQQQQVIELREQRQQPAVLQAAVEAAEQRLLLRGDTAGAVALVDRVLARMPLEAIDPYDRPYVPLALFWASVQRPDRVRSLIGSFDADLSEERHREIRESRTALDAALALSERRWDDALRLIPSARLVVCPVCWHPYEGIAYEGAGQPDAALATYTTYLETPFAGRWWTDETWLPFVHDRLIDLHEQRGDHDRAAAYAADQLELWRNADPELRPRIAALQRVLERAGAERPPP